MWMCAQETFFLPSQILLLVGIPVASILVLVQCLRWHCPWWLSGACRKPDAQEEPVSQPIPLPEDEPPRQCPPATLSEMAAFYQELHTPTQGQTIVRQLMHKLLVFSAREVDHRGGYLMLQDAGISLLIPPGNGAQLPSWQPGVQPGHLGTPLFPRHLHPSEGTTSEDINFQDGHSIYLVGQFPSRWK